jgi:hypothetical protein
MTFAGMDISMRQVWNKKALTPRCEEAESLGRPKKAEGINKGPWRQKGGIKAQKGEKWGKM